MIYTTFTSAKNSCVWSWIQWQEHNYHKNSSKHNKHHANSSGFSSTGIPNDPTGLIPTLLWVEPWGVPSKMMKRDAFWVMGGNQLDDLDDFITVITLNETEVLHGWTKPAHPLQLFLKTQFPIFQYKSIFLRLLYPLTCRSWKNKIFHIYPTKLDFCLRVVVVVVVVVVVYPHPVAGHFVPFSDWGTVPITVQHHEKRRWTM